MDTKHTDILILGAGIGGYEAFRSLESRLRRAGLHKKITLVDQNNYFTFVPLLHEVAVGSVEPEHATLALREVVAGTPHEFIKARVKKIDPPKKLVTLDCSEMAETNFSYDYCVIALGSGVNYFGVPGAAKFAYHIRTLENALEFKTELINRFDSPDPHITISVVGGGATGVEVAGQIAHLVNGDLRRLYPKKTSAIRLIERGEEMAAFFPLPARALVKKRLQKLGVELRLATNVKAVRADALVLDNGITIESDLTLWTAGLKNLADTILPGSYCQQGRIPIKNTLQLPQDPSLYAIGDNAECFDEWCQKLVPQLGEAAHRQGQYVARHLVAALKNKKIKPFHFKSKGIIMPIGEYYGLIVRGNWVLAGFFAWWARRLVYVWFMPGIVRKLKIISDWTLRLFGFADTISLSLSRHSGTPPRGGD